MRLLIGDTEIMIVFKDNGLPFDPLKKQEEAFGNIGVALAISSKISYDYILEMNCSIVRMNLEGE